MKQSQVSDAVLMRRLGAWARSEQLVEDLEALAAGNLRPEQAREVRRRAEASKWGRRAYDAFRPLDDSFKDALTQRAKAELCADSTAVGQGQAVPPESEVRRVGSRGTSSECKRSRRRRPA